MTVAGSRREARERALGLLYEAEAKGESPSAVLDALPIEPDPYAARLVVGVEAHGDEIDGLLRRFARGWKLERMPAVDRAVLRVGTYELLAEPGVPTPAVVSEAVELASQYSTDESGRFVNGLLARIATEVRGDGTGLPATAPPTAAPPARAQVPPSGEPDAEVVEEVEAGPAVDEDVALGVVRSSGAPPLAGPEPDAEVAPSEPAPPTDAPALGSVDAPSAPPASVDTSPLPDTSDTPDTPAAATVRARPPLPLPQPPLGDGVVRLRPWRPVDAPALVAAWSDREVARWSPPPPQHALVDAKRWIDGTPRLRERGLALDLVIAAVGPGDPVLGEVGLSGFDDDGAAVLGYWIAAEHRRRGHATRAVRLLSSWALQHLGLTAVTATVDPANRASVGVLRRAGFTAVTPETWVLGARPT